MAGIKSYVFRSWMWCSCPQHFPPSLASTKDYHSFVMLAYIESILIGILTKADDLLLEYLGWLVPYSLGINLWIATLHTLQKLLVKGYWKHVHLESRFNKLSHLQVQLWKSRRMGHTAQNKVEIIEGDACKSSKLDEECQKATYECKPMPITRDQF